jgi:5-methylthioribose kinase
MLELTADNALDYLRQYGRLGPGPARAEVLVGGVSNLVLRIETPVQAFILKQSRPRLRTRDLWLSDPARIWREQEAMEALHPILPEVVPQVLFADRPNYLFAMSAVPAEHRVWKQVLLSGQVDRDVGRLAGEVLGRMHQATAEDRALVGPFRDATVFVQLRVDPFYRRVQERRPEVAKALAPLIEQLLTRQEALCHGDYTPKNILLYGGRFALVDYETAYLGDPTMDLGLFLAHLVLKTFHRPDCRADFYGLIRTFWKSYAGQIRFRDPAELEARGIGHLGACLLARLDGTSPVDYLPDESVREAVRRLARSLLWDRPSSLEDVLALCEEGMRRQ